jgi:hypothetical protein
VKGIFSAFIAISVGVIVLLGYFIDIPALTSLRGILLDWAVILAAFALFVGIFNIISIHSIKIKTEQKGRGYSILLIVSLLVTLALGLILKPEHQVVRTLFSSVQIPVEKSLMALLVVTLTYASIRLLRTRNNLISVIFLITALLVFLGTVPLPFIEIRFLGEVLRPFIAQVLATAGARGILLGVALGTLTTGLRILFGADRPYGSK